MSASVPSRENVLERIRAATQKTDPGLRAEAYASLPREYVRRGALSAEARLALMVDRLRGYDAEVTECRPETLAGMIAVQLEASGRRRFVAPAGLPAEWMAAGFEWTVDHGLTAAEIETAEGVVTSSFGGAGSVVALLLFMYYSAMILFFGAEFVQVRLRHRGRRFLPQDAVPAGEKPSLRAPARARGKGSHEGADDCP